MEKLRTAVVGAGKMGNIHAKVMSSLAISELVGIVDVERKAAEKLAKHHKCKPYNDPADLIGKVDAVTISTPTVTHLQLAKLYIENGISVLIEKPLAASAAEGKEIVALAKKHNVIAAVGHSERCNPVVQAMKRLEIEPKFIESTRISPFPFRSTDVGVVLDVMIHDIDIILSLANSPIKSLTAVGVNVIDQQEDICNARIEFESGCVANVTASRISMKTERKIRVFSSQAYLSLDYHKKTGTVIKTKPNIDVPQKVKDILTSKKPDILKTISWLDLVHREELKIDDREPLKVEQESFLNAVADRHLHPEVTAEDGQAALLCAEMILESIKEHGWKE